MKYLLILALFAVAATAASIPTDERINGENGWYIPKADGSFEWVDMEEAESYVDNMKMMESRIGLNPVTFYLYTKSNPDKGQEIIAKKKSIAASHFNAKNPTRITIHGWSSDENDNVNTGVRSAWLSHGDYNMITVNWMRARSFDYISSVIAVPGVGNKVATLVDFLVTNYGMKLETLEIIGHSLGAHIAGFTGKNVQSGKIHTIIGLDPALPLFNYNEPENRLCSTDAFYVETIQTNGGKLGFIQPIGKGSFYPNGGKSQPGCGVDLTGACAHSRSVTYYVEAISIDNFSTVKCGDYEDAVKKSCGATFSSVRMGAATNAYMVAGDYFVPVNAEAPFGKLE